jgi:hypothetical protein
VDVQEIVLARNLALDKLQEKTGVASPTLLLDALLQRRLNG